MNFFGIAQIVGFFLPFTKRSEKLKQCLNKDNLKNENKLQKYLTNEDYLKKLSHTTVVYDIFLECSNTFTVMK